MKSYATSTWIIIQDSASRVPQFTHRWPCLNVICLDYRRKKMSLAAWLLALGAEYLHAECAELRTGISWIDFPESPFIIYLPISFRVIWLVFWIFVWQPQLWNNPGGCEKMWPYQSPTKHSKATIVNQNRCFYAIKSFGLCIVDY